MTTPSDPPADQRWYINSWAARTSQRVGARCIDSMIALGLILIVAVVGPHGRPVAQDCLILTLVTLVESVTLVRWGATPGMRALGIRVAVVGRAAHPHWLSACRRTVPVALCYAYWTPGFVVAVIMPWALLSSIALSPLRRGFHDRLSGTVVVQQNAPALIVPADLGTWWEPGFDSVMTAWGRAPDLSDRRRARAHRLDGAWWMVLVIVTATIASVGMTRVPWLLLWLALIWIAVAIIDETWWVTNDGATPGHRSAGYRVVDVETGENPSSGRAFMRALVVVPLLYLPPLQVLLALWVHASALHRGPHDLVAHTVVVEPDFVPPRFVTPPRPPGYPIVPWMSWPPPPPPPKPSESFVPGPF